MGRRPQRDDHGADDRLPIHLLRSRRGDQLHRRRRRRALRRRGLHRGIRTAVRSPGRLRRERAIRWCCPGRGQRLDERPRLQQPGHGDAASCARCGRGQVRPGCLSVRLHERRRGELRPGPVLSVQGRRGEGRRPQEGRMGRRQGAHRRRPACRQDGGLPGQGRGDDGRPGPRPPLPHLRVTGERHLGRLPRRGGHHGFRRVPRAEVPDLHGGRLRDPRSGRDERGDLRPAGPVLGDRPPADAPVRHEDLQAGPAPRRLPDDR